ncbi:hypothetical protein CDD82_5056 [Ophiocordyceps australis]|uniref:Uncharacterized protein n=1 Tax=Ophiocordyceps australis TaxID=1399860 RepID=A0A2C5Z2E7_9HYPO|nr:hypothetical protein CDD82_5056 [Ophiocordyceps australis]
MLMAQALTRTLQVCHESSILQKRICKHSRQEIELLLFQVLVHLLQTQQLHGTWDGCKEATAYALIAIDAITRIFGHQLPHAKISTAMRQGQAVLLTDFQRQAHPDRLWIEKVTFGSRNLSDAYILTALRCSFVHQHRQLANCTKMDEHISIMAKVFKHLPVLEQTPHWLIEASLFEGSLFRPLLQQKCRETFPDGTGSGKHTIFIPATWTLPARSVQVGLVANMQLDMMTLSSFLYTIDHHIETVIGAQGDKERRALRDAIDASLDFHGHFLDTPFPDQTLQKFINYIRRHPKVQSASIPDKTALFTNLRRYLVAHLDQVDDNHRLQQCRTHLTRWTEPRHASLFHWIQSTSSHHTGGQLAFSFFLCLIGSGKGTDTLPSPQAKYFGEELSNRLAALSRLENDYGSLERDRVEGNLNSIDFLIAAQQAAMSEQETASNGDTSSATAVNTTLARAKKHLLTLAEYERRSINRLLHQELEPLVAPKTFEALKMFAMAVDIFGQMYVLKDHTPRKAESKPAEPLFTNGHGQNGDDETWKYGW